jgi:hypothetical protein
MQPMTTLFDMGCTGSPKSIVGFSFFFDGLWSADVSITSEGVPSKTQKTEKKLHFQLWAQSA